MAELPDVSVLELLADGVVVVGADGNVEYCNGIAARLLATTPHSVVGRPAAEAVALTDESGADWWASVQPLAADAALLPRIPMRDLRLHVTPERSRPVTITASRVCDSGGRLAHLLLSLRRAEARQRLDAARSDLVSTVSHEIRSPLTSVKGFTKTLLAKWDRFSDEQKRQMLATVNEDADRVTRLLGELLDVSRIDAGRLQLNRSLVDAPVIAARVAARMRVAAGDSHVPSRGDAHARSAAPPARAVTTHFEPGLPRLYADADKLEQVFTNLVENALKYGEGDVGIAGTCAPDQEEVHFTVSDQGQGIAAQYLAHIFTKFFRRSGERRSGTGLGLYITKGIVEAHGGRIWATSEPGEGAHLHFTLPLGGPQLAGVDLSARRDRRTGRPRGSEEAR